MIYVIMGKISGNTMKSKPHINRLNMTKHKLVEKNIIFDIGEVIGNDKFKGW